MKLDHAARRLRPGLLGVLILSVGCQGKQASPDPLAAAPVPGGTAVVLLAAEPDVLNPLIRTSAYSGQILGIIQASLVSMDEDFLWSPRIAKSWTLSPDSLELTYHLRPWLWSDGNPLTAYDVAETFRLFNLPEVASPRRGAFRDIRSAAALDSATVRYEFAHPVSNPVGLSLHAILPLHLTRELAPASVRSWPLNEQPPASGPYRLASWLHNQELVLERNPYYPGPEGRLERIIFKILTDENARVISLETGEADFLEDVPVTAAARLLGSGQIDIQRVAGRDYGYLMWNLRNGLFQDRRVRKALSLAIDRRRIVESLLGGYGQLAGSPLPPVLWAHNPAVTPDPHDPAAARRLLAEAGWRDSDGDGLLDRDGRVFSFEILTRQGDPVREAGVVVIRENLREVGVVVRPRILELGAAIDLVRQGRFDAYLGVMAANLNVDPSAQLLSTATDRFNYGHYASAEVDSLLSLALSLADRERAKPVWNRLQEVLALDAPVAYLYYPEVLCASSKRLQNVQPHVLSPYFNIEEWWIAPADRKYATTPR
jgi:peptide/nickel transport system substrate-binding protein